MHDLASLETPTLASLNSLTLPQSV